MFVRTSPRFSSLSISCRPLSEKIIGDSAHASFAIALDTRLCQRVHAICKPSWLVNRNWCCEFLFIRSWDRGLDIRLTSGFCGGKATQVGSCKWHVRRTLFRILQECQPFIAWMTINEKHITRAHLCRGQQPGKWANEIALDGTFQVARSVPLIGPFFEQELSSFLRYSEQEGSRCRIQHALLHVLEFDFQYFIQFISLQWVKYDQFIEPVDELRRELAARCFDRGAFHLFIQSVHGLVDGLNESHPSGHQLGDLSAAKIRGHENHGLREVDPPVVA